MGSIGNMDDIFLIEGHPEANTNMIKFNQESPPSVLHHQDSSSGITFSDSFDINDLINTPDTIPSYDSNHFSFANQASFSESSYSPDAPDFSDACIKFLGDILMEEDLDDNPVTIKDYMALQATEKSLYDAIGESYSLPADQFPQFPVPNAESRDDESNPVLQSQFEPCVPQESSSPSSGSASGVDDSTQGNFDWIQKALSGFTDLNYPEGYISSRDFAEKSGTSSGSVSQHHESRRGRKSHQRDESDDGDDGRSNKHVAAYVEDEVQMEQFDDILLARDCKGGASCWDNTKEVSTTRAEPSEKAKRSKGKKSRGKKKQSNNEDVVDLNPLLIQCAQAVATFDIRGANELLKRIRQHTSVYGDSIQRVAHYFADGLEARLAGTASHSYSDFLNWQISASSFLNAYRSYVAAVPFKRTSFFVANKTIMKLCVNATRVHIIDFGIFCGIQWPCFIQALSKRKNGPPSLRITAIDFPERGYQPAARVEETARRLEGYCRRFGVPFEYQAIAQRWETLKPEDFRLESDEVLVVNCLYRGRSLLDDTVELDSPRDVFLKLIRKLNPDLFIHGIVNGTYNAPFFTTRFREALFHYSAVFDMFEATMLREDEKRPVIEREVYGKEILNVVACEGNERVERPETYKQWQVRNRRAGLRQVPLDREIVSNAKAMVRANYHKDFVVDEDNNWMLQGWKGRLLYALSCWKPA